MKKLALLIFLCGAFAHAQVNNPTSTPTGCPTGSVQYPCVVATAGATAQAASISSTPLYTVPSNGAGRYLISCYVVTTQAASTSGTLPGCQVVFTDPDANSQGTGLVSIIPTSTGCATVLGCNTTNITASNIGTVMINAKASAAINYAINGYVTSGTTPLQYAYHIYLVFLGAS